MLLSVIKKEHENYIIRFIKHVLKDVMKLDRIYQIISKYVGKTYSFKNPIFKTTLFAGKRECYLLTLDKNTIITNKK